MAAVGPKDCAGEVGRRLGTCSSGPRADFERLTDFIKARDEVCFLAFEFTTGAKNKTVGVISLTD